jgi:hypothetical protein
LITLIIEIDLFFQDIVSYWCLIGQKKTRIAIRYAGWRLGCCWLTGAAAIPADG